MTWEFIPEIGSSSNLRHDGPHHPSASTSSRPMSKITVSPRILGFA